MHCSSYAWPPSKFDCHLFGIKSHCCSSCLHMSVYMALRM